MTGKRGVNRKATTWAWAQTLPAPSKFVLLALAALATGPEHRVNLSATATVHELAQLCSLSRRTVRTHLRQLEQSHHVVAEERVDEAGKRLANRWHLNVDGLGPVPLSIATSWKDDTWPRTSRPHAPTSSPTAPGSTSMPPELPGMPEPPETAS